MQSVDYSTNALVSQWYSGTPTKYFRQPEMQGFVDKLNAGDTITLGIDFYLMFPISGPLLNSLSPELYRSVYPLVETETDWPVVVFKIWWDGKLNYYRCG